MTLRRIRRSRFGIGLQWVALAGIILQPLPMAQSYWTDLDGNGTKDWVADPPAGDSWFTDDSDGDGLSNEEEVIIGSDPFRLDSDNDGLTDRDEHDFTPLNDHWNWDTDGDGFSDHDALYQCTRVNYITLRQQNVAYVSYFDADGDGSKNIDDAWPLDPLRTGPDSDGDGYPDHADDYPGDSTRWLSPDSDGDGLRDAVDPYPNDPANNAPITYTYNGQTYPGTWSDQDADGIPDPADAFVNDPTNTGATAWFWYQGVPYAGWWSDSDGDTIPDVADAHMSDPTNTGASIWFWYNGTPYPGTASDADGDGIPDAADAYVNDPTNTGASMWFWYNGTAYPGMMSDGDSDGIPDVADGYPNDPTNTGATSWFWYNGTPYAGTSVDTDLDGIPDAADVHVDDPTNTGATEWFWYNGNPYVGSAADDEDGDSIPDAADIYPGDPTNTGATAWYWYQNNAYPGLWADTDADSVPDGADLFPSDPTNTGATTWYWYQGNVYPGQWSDGDGDGIPDPIDSYVSDPTNTGAITWYFYQGQAYPGVWSDSDEDGVPDPADSYPSDPTNTGATQWYRYQGVAYPGSFADGDEDGIPDPADALPADARNGFSYRYGGILYYQPWNDQDGDGIPDPADIWYLNDPTNGTGYCYNNTWYHTAWVDTDGDTVPDPADSWPQDPLNGQDTDFDGVSDYVETHRTPPTNPQDNDSDRDYLTDGEELLVYFTDPLNPKSVRAGQLLLDYAEVTANHMDTDLDTIPDLVEQWYAARGYGMQYQDASDGAGDLDGDGVTNAEAYAQGKNLVANLGVYDSDWDGITNVAEDFWSSIHPGILDKNVFADAVADYDQDGVLNFEEIRYWLDPGDATTRVNAAGQPVGDLAYLNATYQLGWSAASGPDAGRDTDGDGMDDEWEHRYHLNLRSNADRGLDPDRDGLPNEVEHQIGTNPRMQDSNLGQAGNDGTGDADNDGLTNAQEVMHGTNATHADTDGDGFTDGAEVAAGTDPKNNTSQPPSTALLETRWVTSHYTGTSTEAWNVSWMWSWITVPAQGLWVAVSSQVVRGHLGWGAWSKSNGEQQLVDSVNEAQTALMAPQATAPWEATGPPLDAIGKWTKTVNMTVNSMSTPPGYDGNAQTTTAITNGGGITEESVEGAIREYRLKRSAGDPSGKLSKSFIKEITETGQPTTYEGVTLTIPPHATESDTTVTLNGKSPAVGKTHMERLLPVDIVPDDSMYESTYAAIAPPLFLSMAVAGIGTTPGQVGKFGDLVPSVNDSGESHFVSPIENDDDPQRKGDLVFKALGFAAEQLTPNGPKQTHEWAITPTTGGHIDPNDSAKFIVKRSKAEHYSLVIRPKGGGNPVKKMNVWVVEVLMQAVLTGDSLLNGETLGKISGPVGNGLDMRAGIEWRAVPNPPEIITDDERPDLEDGQTRVKPPGNNNGVPFQNTLDPKKLDGTGMDFASWDMSRQLHEREFVDGNWATKGNFPAEPAEGNDDNSAEDEDDDPYDGTDTPPGAPVGGLLDLDQPGMLVTGDKGADGDVREWQLSFKEFARLQIGGRWYLVSRHKPWHYFFKIKKTSGKWNIESESLDEGASPPVLP